MDFARQMSVLYLCGIWFHQRYFSNDTTCRALVSHAFVRVNGSTGGISHDGFEPSSRRCSGSLRMKMLENREVKADVTTSKRYDVTVRTLRRTHDTLKRTKLLNLVPFNRALDKAIRILEGYNKVPIVHQETWKSTRTRLANVIAPKRGGHVVYVIVWNFA